MRLLGVGVEEFLTRTDRVNLHVHPNTHAPDPDAASNLTPVLRGRRVILLGRQVAGAFQLPTDQWMDWQLCPGGFVGASLPHPSARSSWWNDPTNTREAREFLQSLFRPCIHVEGPDGSGKSTLVKALSKKMGFPLVKTDDPPASWKECLVRIQKRLSSGLVCDRSSGLVSELVYGPVLRSKTITPETDLWQVVRSIRYAIAFVYCRPPTLLPKVRSEENPIHVSAVQQNLEALRQKYDQVMFQLDRLGARVVKYDYTRHSIEGVIQCVA